MNPEETILEETILEETILEETILEEMILEETILLDNLIIIHENKDTELESLYRTGKIDLITANCKYDLMQTVNCQLKKWNF